MHDRAQTVLGPIADHELGVTLPHEHLVFDGSSIFAEPAASSDRDMARAAVGWETLSWLRYHPYENLDNVRMLDEDEAESELALYHKAGGGTSTGGNKPSQFLGCTDIPEVNGTGEIDGNILQI